MSEKLKILLIGPSKSGKSTLANFLAGTRETPTSVYYETTPLRILEFESSLEASNLTERKVLFFSGGGGEEKTKRIVVQLWDVGGAAKHQQCWPAIKENADGIIFVFNPEVKGAEKELGLWFKNFAVNQDELDAKGNFVRRVPDKQCLIFAHHSTDPDDREDSPSVKSLTMPKGMEGIEVLESSLDYRSDNFKEKFDKLVERVLLKRVDTEEEEMLQQQREAEGAKPQLKEK